MSIEIDLTDVGGSRVFEVKECCPCADRIECLQAQISQLKEILTEINDKIPHAGVSLMNILPEED